MTNTPEKHRSTRRTRIDKHQAAQAVYIDYESIPGEEPTLFGFASHGVWTAAILDRELADAANWKVPGGNALALTPNEALSIVRNIAISRERKVCAWSEHELRTIQRIYVKQPTSGSGGKRTSLTTVIKQFRLFANTGCMSRQSSTARPDANQSDTRPSSCRQ